MREDVRPMSHELHHVYITGDGRFFLNKDEATKHQNKLERLASINGCDKKEL